MFKGQKGITLVALVITIIVLLILAGVSISLVVGQNGVLTQATGSVAANKAAAAKQSVSLALAACETKYYTQWVGNQAITRESVFTTTEIQNEIKKQADDATVPACPVKSSTDYAAVTGIDPANYVVITVKSNKDEIYVPVLINETTGEVKYGQISMKDKNGNINVNNI